MGKNVDIVYFYEFAVRELDIACAVKCIAQEKYGLRVEILKCPEEYFDNFVKDRPKVVVVPFCYNAGNFYDCLLEWRDAAFFNFACEQLFYQAAIKAKIPQDLFAVKHVIYHAWSRSYADFLLKNGVPCENIFLNGNPACALYLPPYRRYFDAQTRSIIGERHCIDPEKRWVFFPENYNWAFCYPDAVKNADSRDKEDIKQMIDYCRKSLQETMLWCEDAARRGGIEIIIRPRHTIRAADFSSFVNEVLPSVSPNIHIIQEGTVREWIMASDIVVSSYSTSLIEAAVAGKPAFMLEPIPMPSILHVKWHDLVVKIRNKSEFQKACEGTGDINGDKKLKEWAFDTMLSNGDVIMRLAEFLHALCRNDSQRMSIPAKARVALPQKNRLVPWRLLYEFRRTRYLSAKNKKEKYRSSDMIRKYMANQQDIDLRVNKWKEVLLPGP